MHMICRSTPTNWQNLCIFGVAKIPYPLFWRPGAYVPCQAASLFAATERTTGNFLQYILVHAILGRYRIQGPDLQRILQGIVNLSLVSS